MITFRPYRAEDLKEILSVFHESVHTTAKNDYDSQQLDAWAPASMDAEAWDRSLTCHFTRIAVENSRILGFADLEEPDYFDRLYLLPQAQHRGIAAKLADQIEEQARCLGAPRITVHASKTALKFFQQRGYRILREQTVERRGVFLTNYVMEKDLSPHS